MPQGLTKKGEATRERIVRGAAAVVRAHGIANTGLDQIRAATGTSGSQLFHYFPEGKHQLMLAVARHEANEILDEQQPHLGDLSTWESWQAWAEALFVHYESQGANCALSALGSQLDRNDPAVQAIIVDMYHRWEGALERGIRALQASGEASPSIDAQSAAATLLAGVQGGVMMMLATGTTRNLRAALDSGLSNLRRA